MKKNLQFLGILVMTMFILLCLPTILHAQPADPGNPDAPIDGGVSLLVAAGIGYGVKKVRANRKKKQEAADEANMEK